MHYYTVVHVYRYAPSSNKHTLTQIRLRLKGYYSTIEQARKATSKLVDKVNKSKL